MTLAPAVDDPGRGRHVSGPAGPDQAVGVGPDERLDPLEDRLAHLGHHLIRDHQGRIGVLLVAVRDQDRREGRDDRQDHREHG